MYARNITSKLHKWIGRDDRKPLIIRGARQVGKTTLIKLFSNQFEQFVSCNLELPEERKPFENNRGNLHELLQSIFFQQKARLDLSGNTLLFIDEIQEHPEALNTLRYLYEQYPELPVIAAGSMLEQLFNTDVSFPVGRVEYLVLRPFSFVEFLTAMDENEALEAYQTIPLPTYAYDRLMDLYHTYALIGGMPEVVKNYAEHRDLVRLQPIYNSLIQSYLDDVEKYASGPAAVNQIRHVIESSFFETGKRITFAGFGNSNYRSREMGEALRTLEKALILHLVYPTTSTKIPAQPDKRKSPRLQLLDTGLLNYRLGIQGDIIGTKDLHSIYRGTVVEHLTGQELLAGKHSSLSELKFWVRQKASSNAEVDFVEPSGKLLIPVEVKSGKSGSLKSLHLYMDRAPHPYAVRLCANRLSKETITTSNKSSYTLLNLPYFLAGQLDDYLDWYINSYS